jgi:hypothetical protein
MNGLTEVGRKGRKGSDRQSVVADLRIDLAIYPGSCAAKSPKTDVHWYTVHCYHLHRCTLYPAVIGGARIRPGFAGDWNLG